MFTNFGPTCRQKGRSQLEEGEGHLAEVLREGLRLGRLLQFLKLGLPGGFSVAIEAGAWESMVAIAGKLGTSPLGWTRALSASAVVEHALC